MDLFSKPPSYLGPSNIYGSTPRTQPSPYPYVNPVTGGAYKSSAQGINQLATLQPDTNLPDWLTTHPDDLMQELRSTYASIPGLESARPIQKAYNNQINTITGTGTQAANAAAMEAINRQSTGGSQINSEMVKAQTMLPVYDQTSKLEAEKAAAVTQQHHLQLSMMTQVANQMSQLRTSYLSNLGQLQLQKQQQTNQWTEGQQSFNASQVAAAQARQDALNRQNAPSPLAPFSGQMTRMPNNSGAGRGSEFTPQFLDYLNKSGNTDIARQGPMQYPADSGISSGPAIDNYEAYLRNLTHIANPSVAPYNVKLLQPGQGAPTVNEGFLTPNLPKPYYHP